MSSRELSIELSQEAATARRLLERVPDDKLDWRPHPKSMTLGRLAGHIAELPSWAAQCLDTEALDIAGPEFRAAVARSSAHAIEILDRSVAAALQSLDGKDGEYLESGWSLLVGGRKLFTRPRREVIRRIILHHLIHHRGQLSVYLRMLDVPIPQIYGPSADEDAMF